MAIGATRMSDLGASGDDERTATGALERDGSVDCAGKNAVVGGAGTDCTVSAAAGGGRCDAGGREARGGLGLGEGCATSRGYGGGLGESEGGESGEESGELSRSISYPFRFGW